MDFEGILRVRHSERGMTQLDLARVMKVTSVAISQGARVETHPYKASLKALGMSECDLFYLQGEAVENEGKKMMTITMFIKKNDAPAHKTRAVSNN